MSRFQHFAGNTASVKQSRENVQSESRNSRMWLSFIPWVWLQFDRQNSPPWGGFLSTKANRMTTVHSSQSESTLDLDRIGRVNVSLTLVWSFAQCESISPAALTLMTPYIMSIHNYSGAIQMPRGADPLKAKLLETRSRVRANNEDGLCVWMNVCVCVCVPSL